MHSYDITTTMIAYRVVLLARVLPAVLAYISLSASSDVIIGARVNTRCADAGVLSIVVIHIVTKRD